MKHLASEAVNLSFGAIGNNSPGRLSFGGKSIRLRDRHNRAILF